jgi:hypothetical protein
VKKLRISLVALIVMSLILGLVRVASASSTVIIVSEDQKYAKKGLFYLGMDKDLLYKTIKSRKLKIIIDNDNGAYGGLITCENLLISLDRNKKVSEVYASSDKGFRTLKGLKVGDSLNTVIKLYGKKYKTFAEGEITIYQFKIGSSYFNIGIDFNNKVDGWGISKNS